MIPCRLLSAHHAKLDECIVSLSSLVFSVGDVRPTFKPIFITGQAQPKRVALVDERIWLQLSASKL